MKSLRLRKSQKSYSSENKGRGYCTFLVPRQLDDILLITLPYLLLLAQDFLQFAPDPKNIYNSHYTATLPGETPQGSSDQRICHLSYVVFLQSEDLSPLLCRISPARGFVTSPLSYFSNQRICHLSSVVFLQSEDLSPLLCRISPVRGFVTSPLLYFSSQRICHLSSVVFLQSEDLSPLLCRISPWLNSILHNTVHRLTGR